MSGKETMTRKDIINKHLQVAGWNVSDHTQVVEGFDIDVRVRLGVLEPKTKTTLNYFNLLVNSGWTLAGILKYLHVNVKPISV